MLSEAQSHPLLVRKTENFNLLVDANLVVAAGARLNVRKTFCHFVLTPVIHGCVKTTHCYLQEKIRSLNFVFVQFHFPYAPSLWQSHQA